MKIKKRNKLLSVCLVLILAACATAGGVLATSAIAANAKTDTSEVAERNRAVSVDLVQLERDGSEHRKGKELYPLIGNVSDMTEDPNFEDWYVTVKNNGKEPTYARVLIAVPAEFGNQIKEERAINVLFGDIGENRPWEKPVLVAENKMCGDVLSNVYSVMYKKELAKDETAEGYAMYGVYVHKDVTNKNGKYIFNGKTIDYDISKGLGIKLMAQVVQSEGFASPEEAFAASVLMDNPWLMIGEEEIKTETLSTVLTALPNGDKIVPGEIKGIVFDRPSDKYAELLKDCPTEKLSNNTTAYYLNDNGAWRVYILSDYRIELKGSCKDMFQNMSNAEEIVTKNLDTSGVTSMENMFKDCTNLKRVDVSNWDTTNVTNMSQMFYGCKNLDELDVDYWNTANVRSMSQMFHSCSSLSELNTSGWDVSKVYGWNYMFYNCNNLESVDVSGWVDQNTTSLLYMFANCHKLKNLDVSNWDTSNVTDMGLTFYQCYALEALDLSNWNTSKVTSMSQMFHSCKKLTSLNLRGFDTSKVNGMNFMFWHCEGLRELDLSGFSAEALTNTSYMLGGCNNLEKIYVSEKWTNTFDAQSVTSTVMFTASPKLVGGEGTVYNPNQVDGTYARIDGGADAPGYFTYKTPINQ